MKLIIEDDEGRRTVVPIVRDELNIGRGDTNTILLSEKNVSRKHARLLRQEGRFFIEDLQSFTGVKVNGERVLGKRPVTAGDLIQISEYDLFLQAAPGEELPPGDEELVDEDVIITGPIKIDGAQGSDGERDKPTAVIRMENVSGAGQAQARDLAQGERPRLQVLEGSLKGREFVLDRSPIAIGRTAENDVALEDGSVSRYHCKLFLDGDTWKVLDNRSAHGVKVNGEQYATCRVRPGDTIEIGLVKLRFAGAGEETEDEAGVPPPPPTEHAPKPPAVAPGAAAAEQRGGIGFPQVDAAPHPGGRRLLGPAIAACLAIALAIFVVGRVRSHRAPAPVAAQPAEDDSVQTVQIRPEVIQAELKKAHDATSAHKFAEALQHFEAAQRAGATAEELRGARIAQAELRDEQALKKLDAAVAAQHWDEAKSDLDALPTAPGFFADQMRARAAAVRKGYVDDHLARAEAMRAQGNAETCAEEARLALAADASSAHAQQILASCSKPRPQAQVATTAPLAPPPRADPPPPRAEPQIVARAEPPPPQPPTASDATPGTTEPPPPEAAPADPDAQARRLVGEGNQKLLAEDFDSAIALFQRALALKPAEPILATLYRSMGIALTRQGNIEEGAHYYRLYLPLCTNQKEKDYLTRTLEEYEARRR